MTYDQVLAHYGGVSKTGRALGVTKQAVYAWGQRRRIPWKWQIKIAHRTPLKADAAAQREAHELASWARTNGATKLNGTKRKK